MRLYKETRDAIVNKCIKEKFDERQSELEAQKAWAAMELYASIVSPEEMAAYSKLKNSNPKLKLYYADGFRINLNGESHYFRTPTNTRFIPVEDLNFNTRENEKALKLQTIVNNIEDLKIAKNKLRTELDYKLRSISNTNKLRELWPEGESIYNPILEQYTPAASATSTALVSFDNINSILELPK